MPGYQDWVCINSEQRGFGQRLWLSSSLPGAASQWARAGRRAGRKWSLESPGVTPSRARAAPAVLLSRGGRPWPGWAVATAPAAALAHREWQAQPRAALIASAGAESLSAAPRARLGGPRCSSRAVGRTKPAARRRVRWGSRTAARPASRSARSARSGSRASTRSRCGCSAATRPQTARRKEHVKSAEARLIHPDSDFRFY